LPTKPTRIYCRVCGYFCRYRTVAGKHYCPTCSHCCSDEFKPVLWNRRDVCNRPMEEGQL